MQNDVNIKICILLKMFAKYIHLDLLYVFFQKSAINLRMGGGSDLCGLKFLIFYAFP